MISFSEAISRVVLAPDDLRAVAKFEASIDEILRNKFDGTPVRLQFNETIAPKIIAALARSYEMGGWKVVAVTGTNTCAISLTPNVDVRATASVESKTTALPPITGPVAPRVMFRGENVPDRTWGTRLLVRMPTRGRPAQALSVLERYRHMAGREIQIEVVIDSDDETMLTAEVQQRLVALECVVTVGAHKSKIEAVNAGRLSEWDILLLASDDMVPVVDCYADRIVKAMDEHWPHFDGALHFDDGFQGPHLYTLPIIGRRLHAQFRTVYDEAYLSLFSDTEQTAILQATGRLTYVDEKVIEHRHHIWGKADKDAVYEKNDALSERDRIVFDTRLKTYRPGAQWPFNSPPMRLSICIATIPSRRAQLDHLLDHLWAQILAGDWRREVEVLINNGEGTIGEKRQRLLEKAKGHYVAFVDDDDWLSHSYVKTIIEALRANPMADCLALRGVMTTAGAVPETFEHSIKHAEWHSKDGVHCRGPNHLSTVRRDLAVKAGFKSMNHGEDIDYARRLRLLVETEASTGEQPLYFYLYNPSK